MAFCPKCGTQAAEDVKFCASCGAPLAATPAPGPAPVVSAPVSGTGLQPNVAGLLCYVLGWITGLIFFFIEKNRFVRFHAVQSIITFGALQLLQIILGRVFFVTSFTMLAIWSFINMIFWLAQLALWILLMVKAYNKEMYKLPFIGDLAEKYSA
ncbi:MAG TPA: zinc-ribbon domain-containing protein [Symbiobacteriaceae bacterium]|nr:zinc-ribbon domain-containing protein [Symbiobacteriaceae bacterium]